MPIPRKTFETGYIFGEKQQLNSKSHKCSFTQH